MKGRVLWLVLSCLLTLTLITWSCGGIPTSEEEEEEGITFTAPDIIFFNGQVITMEPDLHQAEALAILGEDILAVGNSDEMQSLSGPQTQMIDLGGRKYLVGANQIKIKLMKNL